MTQGRLPPASDWLNLITQDAALRRRFLPRVSRVELAAINQHARSLALETEAWCRQWPMINRDAIGPVSLISIIGQYYLTIPAMLLRSKNTLWALALDDMIDDGAVTEIALLTALGELDVVASGHETSPVHPIAQCLDTIREELSQYPNYELIHPLWASALARVIDGMMFEYWGRGGPAASSMPDLAEYMYFARSSIALTLVWMAGLILEPEPCRGEAASQLFQLAERCAVPMRLANDLAGFDREDAAGELNALRIVIAQLESERPGMPSRTLERVARRDLRDRIHVELAGARAFAQSIATPPRITDRFIRATEFGVDLYLRHDFRLWGSALQEKIRTRQGPVA